MSGLLTFTLAGVGFLLISILDCRLLPVKNLPASISSSLRSLSLLLLSSLFLLHSLVSALSSAEPLGPALPLSTAAASVPLLLHSLSSLLHPTPLLPLLQGAASLSPLFLLSLRRRDPDAIESRYFDLLRVPLLLSFLSAFVAPSRLRTLLRSFALALLGSWLIQMGLSLFSPLAVAHGCYLRRRGGPADYIVWCKGHPEFHRARALATLQFNCHLALMLVLAVGVYSLAPHGNANNSEREYRPLELARFSLADDDEEEGLKDGDVVDVEMKNGFGDAR